MRRKTLIWSALLIVVAPFAQGLPLDAPDANWTFEDLGYYSYDSGQPRLDVGVDGVVHVGIPTEHCDPMNPDSCYATRYVEIQQGSILDDELVPGGVTSLRVDGTGLGPGGSSIGTVHLAAKPYGRGGSALAYERRDARGWSITDGFRGTYQSTSGELSVGSIVGLFAPGEQYFYAPCTQDVEGAVVAVPPVPGSPASCTLGGPDEGSPPPRRNWQADPAGRWSDWSSVSDYGVPKVGSGPWGTVMLTSGGYEYLLTGNPPHADARGSMYSLCQAGGLGGLCESPQCSVGINCNGCAGYAALPYRSDMRGGPLGRRPYCLLASKATSETMGAYDVAAGPVVVPGLPDLLGAVAQPDVFAYATTNGQVYVGSCGTSQLAGVCPKVRVQDPDSTLPPLKVKALSVARDGRTNGLWIGYVGYNVARGEWWIRLLESTPAGWLAHPIEHGFGTPSSWLEISTGLYGAQDPALLYQYQQYSGSRPIVRLAYPDLASGIARGVGIG